MRTTTSVALLALLSSSLGAQPLTHTTRALATLRGSVLAQEGTRVVSGRVEVRGADTVVAPISDGVFVIRRVKPGTVRVTIAAVGFVPSVHRLHLEAAGEVHIDVTLERLVHGLATVEVTARARRDSQIISNIHEHLRVAGGTAFLPGNNWLESALYATDVLRAARGFRYISPSRVSIPRSRDCATNPSPVAVGGRPSPRLAIYIDGERFPGSLEQVNDAIPARDILAVEAYPDVISAPPEWRTAGTCAVVAFWTKR